MSHLRAVPDGPTGPRESTVPPRSGSASSVRVEAPGKVNLFLSVGAPGPDGYHPLTTVFQAVRLIETVTARRQSAQDHGTVTLTLEEPDADVPADESNLAVRAATLLAQTTGVSEGVDLLLRKRVPVAGGMAGGSADAAAALVACNALWGTGLSLPELSALAARLGADVVILDEPTNHLDVEGVDWLARHLRARFNGPGGRASGALVTVTHDRWFLDAICTNVWEVVPGIDPGGGRPQVAGRIETYDGGYAAYVLARAERARQAAVAAVKRENLLRKELAWLRRGAPARTSKPRFRIEAAEALIADVPPPRDTVALTAMATARLGKKVLDLEDVTVRYPGPPTDTGEATQREVLRRVTWRLAPGERVGVVGVNGAGKTTLLRLLEGVQEPTEGRVARGKTVQVATLSQSTHELDALADLRVVEAVAMVGERVVVGDKEMTAAQLVERLGFTRQRAWTRVGEVSGGERRRLQLLRLLMTEPNVLLLDEPTNDLDTDTLAAVEDILDSFPGTLVVVSHDRYLLERVTDHQVALLGDGTVRDLPGGVEQYLQMRREAMGGAGSPRASAGAAASATTRAAAEPTSERSASSGARRHEARKALGRIERKMERSAQSLATLHARMEEVSADPNRVGELAELGRELVAAEATHADLEEQWLEAAEALEA